MLPKIMTVITLDLSDDQITLIKSDKFANSYYIDTQGTRIAITRDQLKQIFDWCEEHGNF